jgi:membrane protease YdiL (CAAX protease family)
LGTVVEGGLAAGAWALGRLLGQPALERLEWRASDGLRGIAASLPLLALFFLLMRGPVGPFTRVKRFLDDVVRPLLGACTLLDLAVLSLVAGVGEEMLFRGVLQGALGRWFGPWVGMAVAGLLFGLAHPITLTYAVAAAAIGIYFGWLLIATDNLLVVITAHAFYDFVALAYLLRIRRPEPPPAPDPPADSQAR